MPNLAKLYKEKQASKPKIDVIVVPKKIKKKDIEVLNINERELQYYNYDEVKISNMYNKIDPIKIYNGILIKNKETILENIKFFKRISPCDKFTELMPSTLTSRGELSNVTFSEESFIKTLSIPPIKYSSILKIGCNFGEVYTFPNPFINHSIFTMVKSILALDGKDIKIGCDCNKNLLNVLEILPLIKIANSKSVQFDAIIKKYIREKFPNNKSYDKKKIIKILKNYNNIQDYNILSDEDIKDLYDVMELYITNISELEQCNQHIDLILKIIKYFTDYESVCTCTKKFIEENNLDHLDKDTLIKKKKNSARGRKIKEKKKKKRKIQGTGLYFSSQVSFDIYNYTNNKITKIKIFRNGNFQVPGVKKPDMSDLVDSIVLLKDYLNYVKFLNNDPDEPDEPDEPKENTVEIPYIISVMRNYTCRIIDENMTILLNELQDALYFEKNMQLSKKPLSLYMEFVDKLGVTDLVRYSIFKYCNLGFYQISEISLNGERYPGILVKFLRPIPANENKKLTIKILSSGKINMDGCTSELEVYEIYYWLQYIFSKYWSEIVYDNGNIKEEVVSDDTMSGYESIYDAE